MNNRTDLYSVAPQQRLELLYGPERRVQAAQRMDALLRRFEQHYGRADERVLLISAPGRTELAGNHTDHNHGQVIAAAVDLDVLAVVRPRDDQTVRVRSAGYAEEFTVRLNDLAAQPGERGRLDALVRGVAAGLARGGHRYCGFDCCMHSTVARGSGLSSSAAVEVFVAAALCASADSELPAVVELAQIAQRSENDYFGKPCGLMDQLACAHGGAIAIDFADITAPRLTPLSFTPRSAGFQLLVVESGASHDDLTADYAAVPAEMRSVARALDREALGLVDPDSFIRGLPELRHSLHERAILRALHFFDENQRVRQQIAALGREDFQTFLRLVNQSGSSSWRLLQNCTAPGHGDRQELALALALSERLLPDGACRVHGGGFAGTMQAYVPLERVDSYVNEIERVFGAEAVTVLNVRQYGPVVVGSAGELC